MNKQRIAVVALILFGGLLLEPALNGSSGTAWAQQQYQFGIAPSQIPCCDYDKYQAVVWHGNKSKMTIRELASYLAPIYWFSPDEPTLDDKTGKDIRVPAVLPFEDDPDKPVVYYQYEQILVRADATSPAYLPDSTDKNNSIIDLEQIAAIDMHFIAYFPFEEGLGGHQHDVEPTAFRVGVWRRDHCKDCRYAIVVMRVTGEAHGLEWYYNTLVSDQYTKFPMTMLVEEGKHGMCTDKNSDGYYTPSYDVNKRVNDAWGVRDIMRSGALFTGGYQAWMSKVRHKEHRVFPPLPEDSPLRERMLVDGEYAPDNAIYELRAFPAAARATDDKLLHHKMEEKEKIGWPEAVPNTTLKQFEHWIDAESFVKSLSIALYADGAPVGVSFVFPLFIVKNFEDPMAGGFLVNRIILNDKNLRDFSWMLLYTPSASRWIDGYFSAGVLLDVVDIEGSENTTKTNTNFVLETGIKFRLNITKTPFKFLGKLTDFWGFRAGVKNTGFFDINRLQYVVEVGAGTW